MSNRIKKIDAPEPVFNFPPFEKTISANKNVKSSRVVQLPVSIVVCQHTREEYILKDKPCMLISSGCRLFGEPLYYSSFDIAGALHAMPVALAKLIHIMPQPLKEAFVVRKMKELDTLDVHDPKFAVVTTWARIRLSFDFFKRRYFTDSRKLKYYLHSGEGKFNEASRWVVFKDDLGYVWRKVDKHFSVKGSHDK